MDDLSKRRVLVDLFGTKNIALEGNRLLVEEDQYPVVDDVIILLEPSQYPQRVRRRLQVSPGEAREHPSDFARDIQYTFGEEWTRFPEILPEHESEFHQYFDLVDLGGLRELRVCDLGCGIGRWSYFLHDRCHELILVDFSEAIFVARRNLAGAENALFFMGDLKRLPFRHDFADLIVCLGVLHHLPSSALDEIKALKRYSPRLLIYLYYALDNRPIYFRGLFAMADTLRRTVSRWRNPWFRASFSWFAMSTCYMPFIALGTLLSPFGLSRWIPLFEIYRGKGLKRIRQDVYDRFFTGIEQRYSKEQIMSLEEAFSRVRISENLPYWHFLCER